METTMRTRVARSWAAVLSAALVGLSPASARAQQLDVNPPLPNVMLLVDNSGSMERMIDGTLPEANPDNTCNCTTSGTCTWNPPCSANLPAGSACPQANRWATLLQALTGTFSSGNNCMAMSRTPGSAFTNTYEINGVAPYDTNYYIPYHRPVAKDAATGLPCVYAPGGLPGATTPNGVGTAGLGIAGSKATDFPTGAIVQQTVVSSGSPASCVFGQYTDGAIDSNATLMRFGLMTFDQDPSAAVGVTGSNTVASAPFTGMWSYYPGWNGTTLPGWAQSPFCSPMPTNYCGEPANCSTPQIMAVGARNPAAPPWEGRLVPFPATTDLPTQETTNSNVQQVLLASRAYGATPLAGMFVGAQYYFQTDPTGPQMTDTFVQGGCRSQYIILLTDGAPNLDLRPNCALTGSPNGVCPFPLPETTAATLFSTTSGQPVTTYVIGFAVSVIDDPSQPATPVGCSTLSTTSSQCTSTDPTTQALYGACCQLNRIAVAGGTSQAYFADNPGDLQNALATILAQIAKNFTTRTTPVYSPVVTNVLINSNTPAAQQSNEEVFLASFKPVAGKPWYGDIQRQRFACQPAGQGSGYTLTTQAINATYGDDFSADLNSNTGPARTFIAFQPNTIGSGTTVNASATIRPYVATTVADGIGQYGATMYSGNSSSVIPQITPAALGLTSNSCTYNAANGGGPQTPLTAAQCRDMLFDYTFAQQSFGDQPNYPFVSRYGYALGDIYHAMPAVVGPPSSLLRDDSYIAFSTTYQSRKQVVYAATNDGLLHAFWADETKLENNELWALMPPAVMPNLFASYPASDKFLLDGSPVIKDVVWDRSLSNQGNATNWHTTLVASFGPSWPGYYAVDVTNPSTTGMPANPPEPSPNGPVFLWQLTQMPSTNAPLFGAQSATPAVTTLYFDPGDGGGAREIGVAILPGGQNGNPTTASGGGVATCTRSAKATNASPVSGYATRSAVQCWGTPASGQSPSVTNPVIGRSLSIVRLDTGEVMRVFMPSSDYSGYTHDTIAAASRYINTPLDSPMTGTPVVYPSDVGTDATRAFVTDADGTLWRFDLSNSNPSQWFGQVYLDLYNTTVDTSSTAATDGQPVQVPLVTSLDQSGNVVINLATGTQSTFTTTGTYYVYSMTETVAGSPAAMHASVNWWLNPATVTGATGERVSGPMTVFNGTLYFATYAAAPASSQSCTSGHGRVWGLDYTQALNPSQLSLGGAARLVAPPTNYNGQYTQPDQSDSTLLGVVIPGVTINATPACAGLPTATSDTYVAGAQHSAPSGFQPGTFSVYSQLGAAGSNGAATRQFSLSLPTPTSPTLIDSWAAVLE
jgi:type IV pilus assembly protein PilY1